MKDDVIYLVVGKSGSGKDTIVNRLVKLYGVRRLDSYTTRPRRSLDDRHCFVDDYYAWRTHNPDEVIVGYTKFKGHHYWATQEQVEKSNLYVIDPDGVRFFVDHYKGGKSVKVIYLNVPAAVRFRRMRNRGDSIFEAIRRVWYDRYKFSGGTELADIIIQDGSVDEMTDAVWRYMN